MKLTETSWEETELDLEREMSIDFGTENVGDLQKDSFCRMVGTGVRSHMRWEGECGCV